MPERNAAAYHADDLALSRLNPELVLPESQGAALKVAEQLVREVDEFLFSEEVRSKVERDYLLKKLDAAIAINNHSKAREMRAGLLQKYPDDAGE
ncbi:MAG: hypothetical protein A3C93_01120 [Candidatus Lloydbacteria bacterium RIFCSPHIGHO2_02_FULL_54_17]|uniref:Uncharacterized protein n=1 Tax=Candidatus Lloydbacteria bacterium RIFCSPHIGHO2_02_FULL_54_17 TaxID=1798664 RepID=A0A1G2DF48_9BACT|nr:MAG: hypothetical protein A2762_06430 [Candidatus Lloydbacteria bacterium RIFCSPHIGHO2_01_FULL_54_11]OGZ11500.1 MAG: hypothetical protein A3C93_01120 [Candidatus Lloydbacteria bacterium RIFCSPHIGHO2_02_FULL_54_17]OGZ14398.1 MAG: hypothetical protein A2948_00475 [Candidatus Lloydbacteria bacterium RIFCSPLOWO2_01_FULL_54_18]